MLFRYAGVIAINPNTDQTEIVKSATGTVHLNENWDTPIEVHDVNGFAMTTLNTTVEGLFPDFYVENEPVVGFQTSSGHRFYLRSSTPVPGPAGPIPRSITALEGALNFEYEDGQTVPGPNLPTPAALADQEIANLVGAEQSATRVALEAAGLGAASDSAGGPITNTVVLFGTSLEHQNAGGASTLDPATADLALGSRGWFHWANAYTGNELSLVRNAGIGGNTYAQMLARIDADVLAYDSDWVFMGGPTNDTSTGRTAAQIIADANAILDKRPFTDEHG